MNIIAPYSITDNNIYSYSEIIYLSGYLKEEGYKTNVRLVHLNAINDLDACFLKEDTIFVVQFWNDEIYKWISKCEQVFKGKKILFGLAAQIYQEKLTNNFHFDYVVSTNSYKSILIWLQSQHKIEMLHTVNEIDYPDYEANGVLQLPYIPIISSRGCTNNCSFCAIACANIFSKKYIMRNAKEIFKEIYKYYQIYKKTRFYFVDSCFISKMNESKSRAVSLAKIIQHSEIKIKFAIETRADCVDKNVFYELKKAGLTSVLIGIENLNSKVLQRYNKQIDLEQILQSISILEELKIHIDLAMILFDPFTTRKVLLENIKGMLKYKLYYHIEIESTFRKLMLIPNSKIENIEKIKYLPHSNDFPYWHNNISRYQIQDPDVQLLSEAIGLFCEIWKDDVNKYLLKINNIRRKKDIRICRKKTFLCSIEAILENYMEFECVDKIVEKLIELEQKYFMLER